MPISFICAFLAKNFRFSEKSTIFVRYYKNSFNRSECKEMAFMAIFPKKTMI